MIGSWFSCEHQSSIISSSDARNSSGAGSSSSSSSSSSDSDGEGDKTGRGGGSCSSPTRYRKRRRAEASSTSTSQRRSRPAHEVLTIVHRMATPLGLVGQQVWSAAFLLGDFVLTHPKIFVGMQVWVIVACVNRPALGGGGDYCCRRLLSTRGFGSCAQKGTSPIDSFFFPTFLGCG